MMRWIFFMLFISSVFSFIPRHTFHRSQVGYQTALWNNPNPNLSENANNDCVECGGDTKKCEHGNEKQLKDQYDHLLNRCCGEVNETDELEELEREFFEIYQKMKKYNKKRVIKTTQQLYQLFRNGKE